MENNINKKYHFYLNGKLYGCGDLTYMTGLFNDYVINMKMYGHEEVDFKIIEAHKDRENKRR